jgi:uncharacterized protein YjiS (DUF1127 family)
MKALWRSIKNWWLDYRTYRILTQLNDYQLKDIGLHRSSLDDQQIRPNLMSYVVRFHKAKKPWK